MTTEFKQITHVAELAGKTIARAIFSGNDWAGIVFTDNTYLYINCFTEDIDAGDVYVECDNNPSLDDRCEMGVASAKHVEENRLKEEEETRTRKAALDRMEREQYERLKAKFEPK